MKRFVLFLILLFFAMPVSADVVSGKITWSGEKNINEKVRVDKGAHLIIEPGSKITFVGGSLEVAGRLTARDVVFAGMGWSGIVLKGCGLDTLISGSEISGAKIGIQVIGGEPRLEELTFSHNDIGAELRQQSEATIAGSVFRENRKVGLFVKDGAAAAVLNNHFEKNGRFGAYIFRSTPRRFSGNVFSEQDTGLMVAYSGSNPKLVDNCFDRNRIAIRVEKAARPIITGSDISGNETGISLYRRADPIIENNLLANNGVGIEIAFSSYPDIRNNDFVKNGKAIYLEFQSSEWERTKGTTVRKAESSRSAFGSLEKSSTELPPPSKLDGTVDASQNWWGHDETAALEKGGSKSNPLFIDDGHDRPTFIEDGQEYPLDRVTIYPWHNKPVFSGRVKQ